MLLLHMMETTVPSSKHLFATLNIHVTTTNFLCFLQGKKSLGPQIIGSFLVCGLPLATEANSSIIHCSVNTEILSAMHQSLPHFCIPEQTGA